MIFSSHVYLKDLSRTLDLYIKKIQKDLSLNIYKSIISK